MPSSNTGHPDGLFIYDDIVSDSYSDEFAEDGLPPPPPPPSPSSPSQTVPSIDPSLLDDLIDDPDGTPATEGSYLSGGAKDDSGDQDLKVERVYSDEEVLTRVKVIDGKPIAEFLYANFHKLQSPYAYIGGEANTLKPDGYADAGLRILVARLSSYDSVSLSMTHSLMSQIYNELPFVFTDFCFLPKPLDFAAFQENKFPVWFGVNTKFSPLRFDVLSITKAIEMEMLNIIPVLHNSGIPIFKSIRLDLPDVPLIVLGGSGSGTTAPLHGTWVSKAGVEYSGIVDAVIYGEGEVAAKQLMTVIYEGKQKGLTKREILESCHGRVDGFYEPDKYIHTYDGKGTLLSIAPVSDKYEFPVHRATVTDLNTVKPLENRVLHYNGEGVGVDVAIASTTGCIGCIPKGSLILTARGQIPIEDVRPSDVVSTRTGRGVVKETKMTGIKPTYLVTTEHGYSFRATENHEISVSSTDPSTSFKSVSSLTPSDHLHIRVGITDTISTLGSGLSYLLGYFSVESSSLQKAVEGNPILLPSSNNEILLSSLSSHFPSSNFVTDLSNNTLLLPINVASLLLSKLPSRSVPPPIFTSPLQDKVSFIQGFIHASSLSSGLSYIPQDKILSHSFLSQVQCLLLDLGVFSSFSTSVIGNDLAYVLTVHGNDSNSKFLDLIYNNKHLDPSFSPSFFSPDSTSLTSRVESVEPSSLEEVYDLSIEGDDHSYTVQGVVVHNSAGWGACSFCVASSSLVQTSLGLRRLDSLSPGDKVQTLYGLKEVSNVYDSGIKEVYRVVTKSGYSFDATLDHEVLVGVRGIYSSSVNKKVVDFTYRRVQDLLIGTSIIISKGISVDTPPLLQLPSVVTLFGEPVSFSPLLAEFLGCIEGRGTISGSKVTVDFTPSSSSSLLLPYFEQLTHSLFGSKLSLFSPSSESIDIDSIDLTNFLKEVGIFTPSLYTSYLFPSSEEVKSSFLRALFSVSGAMSRSFSGIKLSVRSFSSLELTRLLLLDLGIYTGSPESDKGYNSFHGVTGNEFNLFIRDSESKNTYLKKVSFLISDMKLGVSSLPVSNRGMYGKYQDGWMIDSVSSVTLLGPVSVFDISVPEAHHFVANGVVVHNCMEGSQSSYRERCVDNVMESLDTATRRQGTKEVSFFCFYTRDTYVVTSKGMTLIDNLEVGKSGSILDYSGIVPYSAFQERAVQDVLRITFNDNLYLSVTPNHKVQVWSDTYPYHAFKLAEDITVGDFVLGKLGGYEQVVGTPYGNSISKDDAYLLGLLVGDGSLIELPNGRALVTLFTGYQDNDEMNAYLDSHHPGFSKPQHQVTYGNGGGSYHRSLQNWKWTTDVVKDRISTVILEAPLPIVCSYLRGLFTSDGSISSDGKHLAISMKQKSFAIEVSMLLLSLGIKVRLSETFPGKYGVFGHAPGTKYLDPYYLISVHGGRARSRFLSLIGFGLDRKQKLLEKSVSKNSRTEAFSFPAIVRRLLKEWIKESLFSVKGKETLLGVDFFAPSSSFLQDGETISRILSHSIDKFGVSRGPIPADVVRELLLFAQAHTKDTERLLAFLQQDLTLREVTSIEVLKDKPTCDIVDAEHGMIIASGAVVSNSLNFNSHSDFFPLVERSVKKGYKVGLISQRVDMLAETPEQIHAQRWLKKGHPIGTNILTPTGWVEIQDLEPGSLVIGSSGLPVTVNGVFPRGELDVFRVSFSDDTSVLVDDEHLWNVSQSDCVPSGTLPSTSSPPLYLTKETGWLRENLGNKRLLGSAPYSWKIPLVGKIQFPASLLPLDPYEFGLSLSSNPLSRRRSIPEAYLFSSIEDRLALLQGLLDSDGQIQKGCISYSSFSQSLVNSVSFLTQSLGGISRLYVGDTTSSSSGIPLSIPSVFCFFPKDIVPVRSKASLWTPREEPLNRFITSIEPEGSEQVVCISTDAPDSLYVTESCIVTHNSNFTLGVEGISGRMRAYLNKNLQEYQILKVMREMMRDGASELKLFYILCLGPEERIISSQGMIKVKDLVPGIDGTYTLPEMYLFDGKPRPVTQWVKKTARRMLITTSLGQTFEAADYHFLHTPSGFCYMKDLKVGSYLTLAVGGLHPTTEPSHNFFTYRTSTPSATICTPIDRLSTMTPNLAEFLGFYTGDFVVSCESGKEDLSIPYISEEEKKYVEDLRSLLSLTGSEDECLSSKEILEVIFRSTEVSKCSFIRGLFVASGTTSLNKGRYVPRISSVSRDLLSQVQELLLSLGVVGKIVSSTSKECVPTDYSQYYYYEPRSKYFTRFKEIISGSHLLEKVSIVSSTGYWVPNNLEDTTTVESISYTTEGAVFSPLLPNIEHTFFASGLVHHNTNKEKEEDVREFSTFMEKVNAIRAKLGAKTRFRLSFCLHEEMRIHTSLGYRRVGSLTSLLPYKTVLVSGSYYPLSNLKVLNNHSQWVDATQLYYNGRVFTVCLNLIDGRLIESTPDHKFILASSGDWIKASDVTPGMSLLQQSLSSPSSYDGVKDCLPGVPWTNDLALLLGISYSGTCTKSGFSITSPNMQFADSLTRLVVNLGYSISKSTSPDGIVSLSVSDIDLLPDFQFEGYFKKVLPSGIFNAPGTIRHSFLLGCCASTTSGVPFLSLSSSYILCKTRYTARNFQELGISCGLSFLSPSTIGQEKDISDLSIDTDPYPCRVTFNGPLTPSIEVESVGLGYANTFDLVVPEGNVYLTEGLVSHNTPMFPSAFTVLQFAPVLAALKYGTRDLYPIFDKARELGWGRRLSVSGEEPLIANTINHGGRNVTPLIVDSYFSDGYLYYGSVPRGSWDRWKKRIDSNPNISLDKIWGEKDYSYIFPWEDISYATSKETLWMGYIRAISYQMQSYCLTSATKKGVCQGKACGSCDPKKEGKLNVSMVKSITARKVAPAISVHDLEKAARSRDSTYRMRALISIDDPVYRFVSKSYFMSVVARAFMGVSDSFYDAFVGAVGHMRTSATAAGQVDWVYGRNILDFSLCHSLSESYLKDLIPSANNLFKEGSILDIRMDSGSFSLQNRVDFSQYLMLIPSDVYSYGDLRVDISNYFERKNKGKLGTVKVKKTVGKDIFITENIPISETDVRQVNISFRPDLRGTVLRMVAASRYQIYNLMENVTGRAAYRWKPVPVYCERYLSLSSNQGEIDVFSALEGNTSSCIQCGGALELDLFTGVQHPSGVCLLCNVDQYSYDPKVFYTNFVS